MWSHQLIFLLFAAPYNCLQTEPRVLNGSAVTIHHFPFVVAFYDVTGPGDNEYVFGTGTILSEYWVLTAAHLWLKRSDDFQHTKDNSFIRYGASVAKHDDGTIVAIAEILPNEQYKDINVYYKFDYAVLKTEAPMALKRGYAVALKFTEKGVVYPPGISCDLGGYGRTGQESIDSEPSHLRITTIEILDDYVCQNFIPLENGLFCGYRQNHGICDGDSGAPMVCGGYLYAIHTRGTACEPNTEVNIGQFLLLDPAKEFIRTTTGLPV